MNLLDIGKQIARLGAPLLGTAIAGAPGHALGEMVASAFGGDVNNPDDLSGRIVADPSAAAKLAEIESKERIEIQRINLDSANRQLELENDNTEGARQMNLAAHTVFPQVLSTIIVAGFFACIYWISAYKQEKIDQEVLYLLLGILGTAFSAVINYWLGSSADKVHPPKSK